MHNIFQQMRKGFNNSRQHHTVAVALDMSKASDRVNKNKLILTDITNIIKPTSMHSIQWNTFKIQINQHLEYHKLEFGLQCYLKFTSLINFLPKDVPISTYANDIHNSHSISHQSPFKPNNLFKNIFTKYYNFYTRPS